MDDFATPNPKPLDSADKQEPSNGSLKERAAEIKAVATTKARSAAAEFQNKANQLKKSTTEKAQQFYSTAEEKATAFKEEANQKAQAVKQAASEKFEQSKAKAKDMHATSEEYIREHPTKCVLSAFGIGLFIGLLARRR